MINLNLVNHPRINFEGIRSYRHRRGGVGARFRNMDWILLIVGIAVLLSGTAISGPLGAWVDSLGYGSYSAMIAMLTPIAGGICALAALAGKRVFM